MGSPWMDVNNYQNAKDDILCVGTRMHSTTRIRVSYV